ncbi:MAG TPA: undecaprenyl-diphosphate phosphatase [Bacteroidetes bacterium]|nr:undecaprenyl-diphosphate phosphatase [Bacteroidota bacterium]
MDEIIKAVILGIIQGLTEFLPVSSSGHLELAKYFLDYKDAAEDSLMMTVVLHFATACATLVILRKEVGRIFKGLFQFKWNEETEYSAKIILSMVPAVLVGLLFEEQINALFDRQIILVSICLIVTGLLLFWADRAKNTDKKVSFANAFFIGISQAIAILPGISRSGATISTSVLLGIDREEAARFSFLMVVPLIFGKIAKDILDGALMEAAHIGPLAIGFLAAFITGMFACKWMIQLVKNSKLVYFSVYCFIVAAFAIIYYLA